MQTLEQTLLIVNNCAKFTPRIKAQLAKMREYATTHQPTKTRAPEGVRGVMRNCWGSDNLSQLEFAFGEHEYPHLKILIRACLRHNRELADHEHNIEPAAIYLVNNYER